MNHKKNGSSGANADKLWKTYSLTKGFGWRIDKWQGIFIVFVLKGTLKVTINDLDKYVVNSKEMFLIEEDMTYSIDAVKQAQLITCLLHTETFLSEQTLIDGLVSLCNKGDEQKGLVKLPFRGTFMLYLSLLQSCIIDGIDSEYFFDLKRKELFPLLNKYYSKSELAQFLYYVVSKNVQFKEFVMSNYQNVKSVQELAMLANYSTSGFIKKFQRCFNVSPYEWMQKQRAQQILIEIKQGVRSLQEIAGEYKFSSYQHFANFCKKQFGLPPTKINN